MDIAENITFKTYKGELDDEILRGVLEVYKSVFETAETNSFYKKYNSFQPVFTQVAFKNSGIIGFKMGYAIDENLFYSWLGGVKKEYRGFGIASKLMDMQHEMCKNIGFKTIQTKTMNRWRSMLILNIKKGFNVVSTYIDKNGELKIVLELSLCESL